MKIQFSSNNITVVREKNDPRFYEVKEAKGESSFFFWLKKQFAQQHHDLPESFPADWIKKRAWKDGHMLDQMQQYLRTRKPVFKQDGVEYYLCIYNHMWAVQGADYYWNDGSVRLVMEVITICQPELTQADPARIAEQSQKVWEQIGTELGIGS